MFFGEKKHASDLSDPWTSIEIHLLNWNRVNQGKQTLVWLVVEPPTPLKNDGQIVSWDDFSFPTEWKVITHVMFQTTNRMKISFGFVWQSGEYTGKGL